MRRFFLCLLTLCLFFPWAMMADMANPYPVILRQADGKELKLHVYGDEFFHYTTDEYGYLLNKKADGNYYYSSIKEDGSISISNHAYGALQKMMHREQIPQAAKDLGMQRRETTQRKLQSAGLRSASARTPILEQTNPRQLVILVQFPDADNPKCQFTSGTARDDFHALLNEENYYKHGATGSARDYFRENSMQQFNPSFDVYGPYTLSKEMKEYGGNDEYGSDKDPWSMIVEAIQAAADDGVDLSRYSAYGNEYLDNVYVFYAGYSESEGAEEDCIWPHASSLYHLNIQINGMRPTTYACSAELRRSTGTMSGIGTFCHEYAHVLGLWDMYDTDYEGSGGQAYHWNGLSLMASGNYNNYGCTPPYLNADQRAELGWYEIPELKEAGDYALFSVNYNQAYRINTGNKGEYFVVEYRKKAGWDAYIEGEGLLIYHVDKSMNDVNGLPAIGRWTTNTINCYPLHRCMYIVDASNQQAAVTADVFYPSKRGNDSFCVRSKPASLAWSAVPLSLGLYQMQYEGETASFSVKLENEKAHVAGIVRLYDESVLSNAVVQLRPVKETRSASGLRMTRAASDEESYFCRSNTLGQYGFYDIPAGKYLLTCQAGKYMPVSYELELQGGAHQQDIVMLTEDEQYYHESFSWYDNTNMAMMSVGTGGEAFILGARWLAEELQSVVGEFFGATKIRLSSGNPDVTAMIVRDDTVVIAEKKIENAAAGFLEFNFREDSVIIEPEEDYIIAFRVEDYPEDDYPVVIDNGPGQNGKGDLIYFSDTGWVTLSEASDGSIDANWVLSFVTCVNKPFVPMQELSLAYDSLQMRAGEEFYMPTRILPSDATYRTTEWTSSNMAVAKVNAAGLIQACAPGVAYVKATADRGNKSDSCKVVVVPSLSSGMKVQVSQHQILATWSAGVDDSWKLYYSTMNASTKDSLLLDEPLACLSGLKSDQMYSLKVYAYHQSELIDSIQRVVNTPKASGDYPSLYIQPTFAEDEPIMLDVNNLNSTYQKLLWKLDGQEVQPPLLREVPAGKHLMEVQIHYPSGKGVETIQRYIEVKKVASN